MYILVVVFVFFLNTNRCLYCNFAYIPKVVNRIYQEILNALKISQNQRVKTNIILHIFKCIRIQTPIQWTQLGWKLSGAALQIALDSPFLSRHPVFKSLCSRTRGVTHVIASSGADSSLLLCSYATVHTHIYVYILTASKFLCFILSFLIGKLTLLLSN